MMEEMHAGYLWQILKPSVQIVNPDGWDRSSNEAFEKSWYQEKITLAEYQERLAVSTVEMPRLPETEDEKKLLDAIFSNPVSTTKEQKAMSEFQITFIGTKTVRQSVSATVEVSEDDIREALCKASEDSDLDIDGGCVSITVDMTDSVIEAFELGRYGNIDIIEEDIDGDIEFDDIEDIEFAD